MINLVNTSLYSFNKTYDYQSVCDPEKDSKAAAGPRSVFVVRYWLTHKLSGSSSHSHSHTSTVYSFMHWKHPMQPWFYKLVGQKNLFTKLKLSLILRDSTAWFYIAVMKKFGFVTDLSCFTLELVWPYLPVSLQPTIADLLSIGWWASSAAWWVYCAACVLCLSHFCVCASAWEWECVCTLRAGVCLGVGLHGVEGWSWRGQCGTRAVTQHYTASPPAWLSDCNITSFWDKVTDTSHDIYITSDSSLQAFIKQCLVSWCK